jgi:hypothetical protein
VRLRAYLHGRSDWLAAGVDPGREAAPGEVLDWPAQRIEEAHRCALALGGAAAGRRVPPVQHRAPQAHRVRPHAPGVCGERRLGRRLGARRWLTAKYDREGAPAKRASIPKPWLEERRPRSGRTPASEEARKLGVEPAQLALAFCTKNTDVRSVRRQDRGLGAREPRLPRRAQAHRRRCAAAAKEHPGIHGSLIRPSQELEQEEARGVGIRPIAVLETRLQPSARKNPASARFSVRLPAEGGRARPPSRLSP